MEVTEAPPAEAPSPTEPSPVHMDLKDMKWENVQEDDKGCATGAFGMKWIDFTSKQLRQICSSLSIKGVKNAKKATMVDNLTYSNKRSYKTLISGKE